MDTTALARLLDKLRGGTCWALEADRQAAEAATRAWPRLPHAIRRHDRFRSAIALDAVRRGITAVVFGAAGFPSGDPPHRAAAAASPSARYFYPDPDEAVAGQRALSLIGDPRALAIPGTIGDAAGLLARIRNAGAGAGPYQVQWGLAAMAMDGEQAAAAAAWWGKLLPSGSELVIAVPAGPGGRMLAEIAGGRAHAPADVLSWCAGAGLDAEALADVRAHGPQPAGNRAPLGADTIMAVTARKP